MEPVNKENITFAQYSETWFKNNEISWKPSFRKRNRWTLDGILISDFGDKPVKTITKRMIKEWRSNLVLRDGRKKGTKISNTRINSIVMLFLRIVKEASEELHFSSRLLNIKPLRVRKPLVLPFSLDEIFKFLEYVPEYYRDYYIVRFFSGMRTAEIDGLKWKYVDFNNRQIQVRETWYDGEWGTPRTNTSNRDIDMTNIVEEALLRQKKITGDKVTVFLTPNEDMFGYKNITELIWYPTLKNAGLVTRVPYQTRHTTASMWLASGENPEWVARQLGHSNTKMLFRVYSKFIPNLTRRDGSAFAKFFVSKLEEYEVSSKTKEEDSSI